MNRALVACLLAASAAWAQDEIQPSHGPQKEWTMRQRVEWLWDLAVKADQSRKYDVAEAYMWGILALMPESGYALGNQACYVGKQGRFREALDLTNAAENAPDKSAVQLAWIKATWLAHLNRKDEAEKAWRELPVPAFEDRNDYEMYHVGKAFYAARIEKSPDNLKQELGLVFKERCTKHWLIFFEKDVSFDDYRAQDWFKETIANARALLKE